VAAAAGAGWVAVIVVGTLGTGVASAHAFLVSSDPAQGARLVHAPTAITLRFSEKVTSSGTTVQVRLAGSGRRLPVTADHAGTSNVVRAVLSSSPDGIYQVSWQTLSADDGHTAFGEFAFAAGHAAGSVPAATQRGAPTDPVRVAATVLFLFGLAAGAGGALTAMVVDRSVTTSSVGVRVGLFSAAGGAGVTFINDLGRYGTALSRPATIAGLAAVLTGTAMLFSGRSRRPLPVVVALVAAGVVWSDDGHPAVDGGTEGMAVNAVHLVAGTVWAGTLGYLLVVLVRQRANRDELLHIAGRYSRLALPLVVVLGAAGGVSALEVLPSWSSLFSSGYGQLIVVKTTLFAAAVGLAVRNRLVGIRQGRPATLRAVVPFEAAAVAVILVVTGFLTGAAPPVAAQPAAALLGPAPLSGPAVRAAGLAGQLNVAVTAGSGRLQVQVFAPDRSALDAHISVDAFYPDGSDVGLFPRPCGNGCFTQALLLPAGTTRFVIDVTARHWKGGTWSGAVTWPPTANDPKLLNDLITTMDAAPQVVIHETVTSNTARAAATQTEPPIPGRQLMALEPYAGGDADHPEASAAISDVAALAAGGPGFELYLPGEPILATLWLDPQGRLARQRIVDLGHVITDTFDYPNQPPPPGPSP